MNYISSNIHFKPACSDWPLEWRDHAHTIISLKQIFIIIEFVCCFVTCVWLLLHLCSLCNLINK